MGLQHLFDQVDAVQVADAQQDDRQIARDGKAPQPGLTKLVAGNDAGRGAAQGIAVNDGAGQAAIDLCIGFGCVEVAQHLLALEPGHFEGTLDEVRSQYFSSNANAASRVSATPEMICTVADSSGDKVMVRRIATMGSSTEPSVFDNADGAVTAIQHHRVGRRSTATDESGAVGLVRRLVGSRARRCQQVKHPRHLLPRCAAAARAEDRLPVGQDFGLHEQVAEGAMGQVGIQRRQHDFRVTRHLDMTGAGRQVGERDTADLDVVFG